MPQPRDLTGSIYKSKKLKSTASVQKAESKRGTLFKAEPGSRGLRFSTFSFSVGLLIAIAILGQFALMTLFRWV
ncbi:hypothetical protein F7C95_19525 [Opitutia bacterium ISCC 51]|nr:hypothetical protein F7C95_19525 [Opitutae bacterium ISCC 51]QXD28145.1 hypothetical protein GA003_19430 [Opitutae bacterium ISCC 52]